MFTRRWEVVFFLRELSKKAKAGMIFHLQSMLNAALYPTAETFPASYECVRMFERKYYMKKITRIQNGCSPIGIMVWFQKAFCQTCSGLFVILFQNKAPTELFVHLGPYVCLPDILNVCQNSLGPAAIERSRASSFATPITEFNDYMHIFTMIEFLGPCMFRLQNVYFFIQKIGTVHMNIYIKICHMVARGYFPSVVPIGRLT